jgi:TrmH family RNA methyltransferase
LADELRQLVVVLVRTRNPLNIGAVARAMQNFGVNELRLVAPYEASFREARSAVGAGAVLGEARECASVAEAVADCGLVIGTTAARRRELEQPLVALEQAATPVRAGLTQGRVALLFGSEKHGLRREDLEHCHWLVRIATEDVQPSMNLGQAVAVCLWELARDTAAPAAQGETGAASGELERLGALLIELLEAGGYTHSSTSANTESEVRRTLRRLQITDADAHLIMGMVRKLLWKVRSSSGDGK